MAGLARTVRDSKSVAKKKAPREFAGKAFVSGFPRITRTPGVMGGKPCIKGSRITVGMIAAQLADGATVDELLDDFPELKREDIMQAIGYAGWFASDMLVDLGSAA